MDFGKEKLLIISPHADDEVIGCSGLINKIKDNGGKVYVQILTMGGFLRGVGGRFTKETWKKEFLQVVEFLKIDGYDIAFYNNEMKHLDTMPLQHLIDYFDSKSKISISKIRPTIVAIPTIFSTHQDHVHVYKAAISSLRPRPQSSIYLPKMVISYESPQYYFWSAYSEFGKFFPNFYLQMSKMELDRKIKALYFYKSQFRRGYRDGDRIAGLSVIRGSEIGVQYAEAYHVHRYQL